MFENWVFWKIAGFEFGVGLSLEKQEVVYVFELIEIDTAVQKRLLAIRLTCFSYPASQDTLSAEAFVTS